MIKKMSKLDIDISTIKCVDLENWGLPETEKIIEELRKAVRMAAAEAIMYSVRENIWFGFEIDRPLVGRVALPLADDSNEGPTWEVDLRKEFFQLIDMHVDHRGLFDAGDKPMMQDIRDELATLVEAFDRALG